jgi:hypothetical protein
VRRQAFLALVVVCVVVPAAAASTGHPKKKFTAADQAAAKAATLMLADVGSTWIHEHAGAVDDWRPRCPYVYEPDFSDLVETGESLSEQLTSRAGFVAISSTQVFQTPAMALASHTRSAVIGLPICLGSQIQDQGGGTTVIGRGPLRFVKFGNKTNAFRVNLKLVKEDLTSTRLVVDIVLVTKNRTQLTTYFIGVRTGFPRSFEQLLIRRVLSRAI